MQIKTFRSWKDSTFWLQLRIRDGFNNQSCILKQWKMFVQIQCDKEWYRPTIPNIHSNMFCVKLNYKFLAGGLVRQTDRGNQGYLLEGRREGGGGYMIHFSWSSSSSAPARCQPSCLTTHSVVACMWSGIKGLCGHAKSFQSFVSSLLNHSSSSYSLWRLL